MQTIKQQEQTVAKVLLISNSSAPTVWVWVMSQEQPAWQRRERR